MIDKLKNGVTLKLGGRSGNIYYKESGKFADFYVEMGAMSSEFGVLIWFKETRHWTVPENEIISAADRENIKQQIIKELERKNIKSDILDQE